MTLKVFLSPAAEEDIDEIIDYLSDENPSAARAFLNALFNTLEKLSDFPDLGHRREDLTDKPVKFFTFKWHYLIVYKPVNPVEIVRVLSGYRDIISLVG